MNYLILIIIFILENQEDINKVIEDIKEEEEVNIILIEIHLTKIINQINQKGKETIINVEEVVVEEEEEITVQNNQETTLTMQQHQKIQQNLKFYFHKLQK